MALARGLVVMKTKRESQSEGARIATRRKVSPHGETVHGVRKAGHKLKDAPKLRFTRFLKIIVTQTPFVKMLFILILLWLLFSAGIYFAEQEAEGTTISSYG